MAYQDLREFILADFDIIRMPQWAARAEYFKNDFHAEAIWVPVMTYDQIGKPGADFYPYPPAPPSGFAQQIEGEVKPGNNSSNFAYGARASYIKNGWDGALYYYRSTSASPTFYRQIITSPAPTYVYQPRHDRIWQAGATLAKDFGDFVFKLESVYTANLGYNVMRSTDDDGVVKQNTLDYIISVDLPTADQTRWNVQLFQRIFFVLPQSTCLCSSLRDKHDHLAPIGVQSLHIAFDLPLITVHLVGSAPSTSLAVGSAR